MDDTEFQLVFAQAAGDEETGAPADVVAVSQAAEFLAEVDVDDVEVVTE